MSVFVKILRFILCCSEEDLHKRDYETLGRDSLVGRSYYDSSVSNSSRNNHDLLRARDPNKIYYYDYYPNVSSSSPTIKKPGVASQQSDYDNKLSMKGTNEVPQSLKSTRPLPPSSSYYPCPSSPKSPQSLPKLKPSPSNPSLSSSTQHSSFSDSHKYSSKSSFSPPKAPQSSTGSSTKPFLSSDGPVPSSFITPSSSIPKPAIPSSKAFSSLSTPACSSLIQSLSSPNPPSFTSDQHQLSAKPPASSLKPSPSPSESSPSLGGSSQLISVPTPSFLKAPPSSKPTLSPLSLDSKNEQTKGYHVWVQKDTSPACMISKDNKNLTEKDAVPEVFKKSSLFSQKVPSSSKPNISPLPLESPNQQKKACYIWVCKGTSSLYKIPKDFEDLIKKDIVPDVLKKPLSPSTYKDCFAALLYAEDFYLEKWSGFQLLNVTLKLREAAIYDKSLKNKHLKKSDKKDDKLFVVFEIDSVPERRPFLLSRDFVFAQRSGGKSKKFQGLLYRVVKSNTVLVEFEKAFYTQHHPNHKYDISFSFNRVCLKRAHRAIAAASDHLFHNYLFPDCAARKRIPSSSPQLYSNYKHSLDIDSAVLQILSFEGQPPYLIEGPLCVSKVTKFIGNERVTKFVLSKTGIVVQEAVLRICQCSPNSRILICAPLNRTCDVLMEKLMENIPESDMFRANATFREVYEVPDDILQASLLEGECFSCPPLQKLRQYRVIFSTFVSSFRLHKQGITAGHFSHIFLVDASSAIEPETVITLSNLANENTTVIVTGAPDNCPGWVRSDIARKNGLKMSYFERLCQTKTYRSCDPKFFTRLSTSREDSDSSQSFSYIDLLFN